MNTPAPPPPYVLGGADSEHDRLIRQAAYLEPITERLFRDAGIGLGQRVLDIGSGVGDVALLAARLVGPAGQVVGVDRDTAALAKARSRAAAAAIAHVRFVESDVAQLGADAPFDAVVGRFILMFLPDPVATLRALAARVRPGGVLVFQEPSWAAFQSQMSHLPLWSACATIIIETLRRSGARADMGLVLYRAFLEIGLPVPELRVDIPMAQGQATRRWVFELLCTLRPRLAELGLPEEPLGNFDTLYQRLEHELDGTRSYASAVGLVGAWSRKPET